MFHYNNGLLATSGFDGGGSCVQPSLTQDAFWIWTAHANGDYLFEVLGAIYETGVKIYAGTDCTQPAWLRRDRRPGALPSWNCLG